MVRDSTWYLLLHYLVLITIILLLAGTLELYRDVPIWVGLVIAVVVGLTYPRIIVRSGYAPSQWEA